MKRRDFMKRSVYGLSGAMLGQSLLTSCSTSKKLPNILIFVSDDTGWNDVGYHGSEIKTPHIDRLVREGVELDQFYVSPVCSPTRASLLTGKPPTRYGISSPIAGKSKKALPAGTITLAEFLRRNGYQTAITGKWHLGLSSDVGPRKYGFGYTYGYLHGQIDPYTHLYKYGDKTWHRNDVLMEEEGHATDLITREAIEYIRTLRDPSKPFFLYVPYSVPHFPLIEESRWTNLYRNIHNQSRKMFAASMTHMDHGMGQILEALADEGIHEETLVIYFSDNGGQEDWSAPSTYYNGKFDPHDQLGDNRPLRGWKGDVYEGGIRVPAVLSWSGRLKPHQIADVIAVQDLYPTIAHLIGAAVPPSMEIEGVNIWPAVTGKGSIPERILYWRREEQTAVRKGPWKLIVHGQDIEKGKRELFNIDKDPEEQSNINSDHPDIVQILLDDMKNQIAKDHPINKED